ncbi:MAG: Mov34/MPN/PAD-1 family protein [Spirochaetes bacterium]|nr:Mov34/MPN/PAD-1 family protein [Spirochaetota bacterium]
MKKEEGRNNNATQNRINEVNSSNTPDRVIIYKGELEYISRCILDYPNLETGGNLFGFYTTFRIPVIQYVLGPGENSVRSTTHFIQDNVFFNTNADMLINDHALHHIGTWHSHHKLAIDQPSGGDVNSMFDGMRADGLENFLLVIGNNYQRETSANAYRFCLQSKRYQHCHWVILDGDSPIRNQFDKKHRSIVHIPRTNVAMMQQVKSVPLCGEAEKKVSYSKGYWLNDDSNKIELKNIADYLKNKYKNVSFFLQEEDQTLKATISDNDNYSIVFPLEFPKVPPIIHQNNKLISNSGWDKTGLISQMFINYFNKKIVRNERFEIEHIALQNILSEKDFKFLDFDTDKPYFTAKLQTSNGKVYTIKIDLTYFPGSVPDVFIVKPKSLLTFSGHSLLKANHDMHTLDGKDGFVRISYCRAQDWRENVSLYKIVNSIRAWLEMYEKHLKTGKAIDFYQRAGSS